MYKPHRERGGGRGSRGAASSSGSEADGDGGGGGEGRERLLPPPVECRNETDIFETLLLAYVPPTMRYFHDYK